MTSESLINDNALGQIDTHLTAVRRGRAALSADEARTLRADLARLNPREREILERRFGLDGTPPQSLRQVGERLGISGERVRQLEHRALACIGVTHLTTGAGSARAPEGVTQSRFPCPARRLRRGPCCCCVATPRTGMSSIGACTSEAFTSRAPGSIACWPSSSEPAWCALNGHPAARVGPSAAPTGLRERAFASFTRPRRLSTSAAKRYSSSYRTMPRRQRNQVRTSGCDRPRPGRPSCLPDRAASR